MNQLALTAGERARYSSENALIEVKGGNETLVGLTRDEAERLTAYNRSAPSDRERRRDYRYLRERHQRGMSFWRRAVAAPGSDNHLMTSEDAFDVGFKAWDAHAGAKQLQDFDEMMAAVPKPLHIAALNGWLSAFDDEGSRLRR